MRLIVRHFGINSGYAWMSNELWEITLPSWNYWSYTF